MARSRRKIALSIAFGIVVVFLLGDFIYSRIVAYHHNQWEQTIVRDENGVREGCQPFSVGAGDTAILLVHGINDSPHFYYKMAPRLAAAGFACHAMRLPGFAEPSDSYAKAKTADWVRAVAEEAARLREAHDHVCIVAHSLGAAVAIKHLLAKPDAADCVVLLTPGIAVANDRSPVLPTRAWHEISRFTVLFTNMTESPFSIDAEDPAEAGSPFQTPFTPRAIISQTFTLFDQNRGRAGEFHTPMLMVLGAHDKVIDPAAAREFYEAAASSPKQLSEMPDAAHAVAVDYGWEKLADEIAAFVRANQ